METQASSIPPPRPRPLVTAAKIAAGLLLLALILYLANPRQSWLTIREGDYTYVTLAFGLLALHRVLEGSRLYVLIRRFGFGLWELVSVSFVTAFVNNFAPTSVLGEGYRVYYVRDRLENWREAVAYILIDKVVALAVVVGAFFVSVLRPGERHPFLNAVSISSAFFVRHQLLLLAVIAGAAVGLVALVWSGRLKRSLGAITAFADSLRSAVAGMGWISSVVLFALTVAVFVVAAEVLVCLALAFGASVPLIDMIALVSISYLSAFIPLTFGGLGVREGIIVFCLGLLGVDHAVGMAVALTSRVLTLLIAGLGGMLLLRGRSRRHVAT